MARHRCRAILRARPQVQFFYRSLAPLAQCNASMDRFLPPESRFCVPLVTITFKTWVFLNFAMERPSRFASLKAAIPRTREWMQADVATRQADEPVRNRPGSGQSRPDPTGPAAAGRAEGDQSCRPFH